MISLKRYLDMKFKKPHPCKPMADSLIDSAVMSYRYPACPDFGARLQPSLSELAARLSASKRMSWRKRAV